MYSENELQLKFFKPVVKNWNVGGYMANGNKYTLHLHIWAQQGRLDFLNVGFHIPEFNNKLKNFKSGMFYITDS